MTRQLKRPEHTSNVESDEQTPSKKRNIQKPARFQDSQSEVQEYLLTSFLKFESKCNYCILYVSHVF